METHLDSEQEEGDAILVLLLKMSKGRYPYPTMPYCPLFTSINNWSLLVSTEIRLTTGTQLHPSLAEATKEYEFKGENDPNLH
jgi:hypothetical protein